MKEYKSTSEVSLNTALESAKQSARYFRKRDEMNAEVHLEEPTRGLANVRWSPITKHAEDVFWFLSGLRETLKP